MSLVRKHLFCKQACFSKSIEFLFPQRSPGLGAFPRTAGALRGQQGRTFPLVPLSSRLACSGLHRAAVPLPAGQLRPGRGRVVGGHLVIKATGRPSRRHKMAARPAPAGLPFPACPAPPREMAAGRDYSSRRAARRLPARAACRRHFRGGGGRCL